jgi:hypothetical protein
MPCGYSMCKDCYKTTKLCVECEIEHIISEDQFKENHLAQDIVNDNLEKLTLDFKELLEEKFKSLTGSFNSQPYIDIHFKYFRRG